MVSINRGKHEAQLPIGCALCCTEKAIWDLWTFLQFDKLHSILHVHLFEKYLSYYFSIGEFGQNIYKVRNLTILGHFKHPATVKLRHLFLQSFCCSPTDTTENRDESLKSTNKVSKCLLGESKINPQRTFYQILFALCFAIKTRNHNSSNYKFTCWCCFFV